MTLMLSADAYLSWRRRRMLPDVLKEAGPGKPPPERLLQEIWRQQRLLRDRLRTWDGRSVRVLHPGFANRERGPDFRGAVLRFDREPACVGDVEIDLHPGLWQAHGHHQSPDYSKVLLHVVWEAEAPVASSLPMLVLNGCLDSPLTDLTDWLAAAETSQAPPDTGGHCSEVLAALPGDTIRTIILQAAAVRLRIKAHQLEAQARQTGWEQALWEGLFRALGYKNNAWPMQRLAEMLPESMRTDHAGDALDWEARLFGIAGLLPSDLPEADAEAQKHLARLWDRWWREQELWRDVRLPAPLWNFSGIRPANHPQRRLALAAHWLGRGDLISRLTRWFAAECDAEELSASLETVLQPDPDPFWDYRWTLQSRRAAARQPLLGPSRAADLAMNVILPWFWVRARACGNQAWQTLAEQRYFRWPASDDNAVLRQARRRLFPHGNPKLVRSAGDQQGLLQIVHDWCDHFDATCNLCPWPDLLRQTGRIFLV